MTRNSIYDKMTELQVFLSIFLLVTHTSAGYQEAFHVLIIDEILEDITGYRMKEFNIFEDCALLCLSDRKMCSIIQYRETSGSCSLINIDQLENEAIRTKMEEVLNDYTILALVEWNVESYRQPTKSPTSTVQTNGGYYDEDTVIDSNEEE